MMEIGSLGISLVSGGGQVGGGTPGLSLTLDNYTIPANSVEDVVAGNLVSANGTGPFTDTDLGDVIVFAPDSVVFSDVDIDDLSAIGAEVCTLTSPRPNVPVNFSVVNDPDGKFGIDSFGNALILIAAVDKSVASSHLVTIRSATAYAGQFFDQATTIFVGRFAPNNQAATEAWYDPRDISTMFQDVNGVTPVEQSGDPVALWLDKYGNGHDLVQASPTKCPLYIENGDRRFVWFDGVDDYMVASTLNVAQPNMIFMAVSKASVDGYYYDSNDSADRQAMYNGAAYSLYAGSTMVGPATTHPLSAVTSVFDGSSSEIRINGVSAATGNAGADSLSGFTLGSRYSHESNWSSEIEVHSLVITNDRIAGTDLSDMETYVGYQAGLTI